MSARVRRTSTRSVWPSRIRSGGLNNSRPGSNILGEGSAYQGVVGHRSAAEENAPLPVGSRSDGTGWAAACWVGAPRSRGGGPGCDRGLRRRVIRGRLEVLGRGAGSVPRRVVARGGLLACWPPRLGVAAGCGFRLASGAAWRCWRCGDLGHAAQDRAVVRVAQPHHAFLADFDPVEPLRPEERSVGAAEVFYDPAVSFGPHLPVPPRHARVGHDNVRTWGPGRSGTWFRRLADGPSAWSVLPGRAGQAGWRPRPRGARLRLARRARARLGTDWPAAGDDQTSRNARVAKDGLPGAPDPRTRPRTGLTAPDRRAADASRPWLPPPGALPGQMP